MPEIHPFLQLRRSIRRTGRQYRHNNDNSESLFHPKEGFIYAYDIGEVENALDEYEKTLPTDFHEAHQHLSLEDQIERMAREIVDHHKSMEARDLARTVLAYFAVNQALDKPGATITRLTAVDGAEHEDNLD